MTGKRKRVNVTMTFDPEVAEFISEYGGVRQTDIVSGRINFSNEVQDFIRKHLMTQISPDAIGYALAREIEEHKAAIELANRKCKELLGCSTIEEWLAQDVGRARSKNDAAKEQLKIRAQIAGEQMEGLLQDWEMYRTSKYISRENKLSWLHSRLQRCPAINLTPEEFLVKYDRAKDRIREPEVA